MSTRWLLCLVLLFFHASGVLSGMGSANPCLPPPTWPNRKASSAGCPRGHIWNGYSGTACEPVCSAAAFDGANAVLNIRVDAPVGSNLSSSVLRSVLAALEFEAMAAYKQPTGDVYLAAPAIQPGLPSNVLGVSITYGDSDLSQLSNPNAPAYVAASQIAASIEAFVTSGTIPCTSTVVISLSGVIKPLFSFACTSGNSSWRSTAVQSLCCPVTSYQSPTGGEKAAEQQQEGASRPGSPLGAVLGSVLGGLVLLAVVAVLLLWVRRFRRQRLPAWEKVLLTSNMLNMQPSQQAERGSGNTSTIVLQLENERSLSQYLGAEGGRPSGRSWW